MQIFSSQCMRRSNFDSRLQCKGRATISCSSLLLPIAERGPGFVFVGAVDWSRVASWVGWAFRPQDIRILHVISLGWMIKGVNSTNRCAKHVNMIVCNWYRHQKSCEAKGLWMDCRCPLALNTWGWQTQTLSNDDTVKYQAWQQASRGWALDLELWFL